MEKVNNNLKLSPLAGFVAGILTSNNIDIKKSIYTEKTIFGNNDYHYYLYLDKEIDIKNIYDILKSKLNQSQDFIELQKNYILIENGIELIKIMNYKLSFLEKIKENLIKLF